MRRSEEVTLTYMYIYGENGAGIHPAATVLARNEAFLILAIGYVHAIASAPCGILVT